MNDSLSRADASLISPDIEYLAGVSGGRDSMVLLHWLRENGCKNLVVCHFNHALRGKESDDDERFVKEAAARWDCAFVSVKNDSRVFARQSRQSLETAARESRYRFFARVAKDKSCQRLILAHHADDQAETVLMNIFRGAGLKGLGGMLSVSHQEVDGMPLEVIRPFLQVTREELETYRAANNIPFREDSTNNELLATRNRVRHELIPLVTDIFQRDAKPSVLKLAEIAAMEYSAAQLRAGRWISAHQKPAGGLPLKPLRQLPPADLGHVLHLWLKSQNIRDTGFDEIKAVTVMVRSDDKPAKVNLPGARYARRRSGVVFIDDNGGEED